MTLENIAPNVWCVYQPLKVPIFGELGTRMTVVRLSNNSLVIISPIKFDEKLKSEIEALGTVATIIAPNPYHTKYLRYARSVFPQANVCGPKALSQKRKDIPFSTFLNEKKEYPGKDELELIVIRGRGDYEEFVFIHKPSRTMVTADLVFNVTLASSFLGRLALRWNKANRFGMTRIGKLIFSNRQSLRDGLRKIYALQPERIILAHGKIISEGATPLLEKAFHWV